MPALPGNIIFAQDERAFRLGLSKIWKDELKIIPQSYKEWLREEDAKVFFKTDWSYSGLGTMGSKAIGAAPNKDKIYFGEPKTFTMKTYGSSLVIQYEVIRWDLYGIFENVAKELAKTAMTRYDIEAYQVFNQAFSTSDPVYTDHMGEALCSVAHTRMDGGIFKNRPTTDVGLSMMAMQTATSDIRRMVNERGKIAKLTPKILMTTVENQWLADTLLNSKTNPDNANQQKNVLSSYNLTLHIGDYINTQTNWFVLADQNSYEIRMAHGDRPDLITDTEPATRNSIYNSYMSVRMEIYRGRGIYGSVGA
jgi:hypothetical protein